MRSRYSQIELPFQPHSDTSVEAAEALEDGAPTLRMQVFLELVRHPQGLTDEELQRRLRMNPSTERPRRIELLRMGAVRDSGRTRSTRSGRQAVVWEAVRRTTHNH